ncbi:uncharacterized protein LOC141620244 [Silene latifolia]|uniref:uncharacterized protein LOC141620244 n=1 Tax=Silene latifolia TaxID=37657 RepID=UPI003D779A9E
MVWKEHYFYICINFKTETVEVLDNTEYADWEQTQIHKVADLVAEHMSDYLAKKNVERADDIITFDVVNINFPWQKTEMNNTESGNFLMMHMIQYEGVMFEANLNQKVYRRYYWLEMTAALLLADINENRTPLIEKVKEFSDGKDEIWKTLKQQRKNNEKAKGKQKEEVPMAEVQTKENADVVVEETNKEDVPETAKEDCTKKPIINTELPILRQSHRKR